VLNPTFPACSTTSPFVKLQSQDLTKIANDIRDLIQPERIVLFGSYAYGQPRANSDVDLLVIKKGLTNRRDSLVNLKKSLISKDYSLDILLYSEKEYAQKRDEGWQVFEEIEKKGKPI